MIWLWSCGLYNIPYGYKLNQVNVTCRTLNMLSLDQVKQTTWILPVVLHFSEHEFELVLFWSQPRSIVCFTNYVIIYYYIFYIRYIFWTHLQWKYSGLCSVLDYIFILILLCMCLCLFMLNKCTFYLWHKIIYSI